MKKTSNILYHGTSLKQWKEIQRGERGNEEKGNDKSSLYLVNDYIDAKNYAYETAASDEYKGSEPQPIICEIDINDLKKLDVVFEPDWGSYNVTDNSTWEDTYNTVGSFSIYGDINSIKGHFKIITI